jgi:outer membrane protein TolC
MRREAQVSDRRRSVLTGAMAAALMAVLFLVEGRPAEAQTSGRPDNPFSGSVPTGQTTGSSLGLSLRDALDRALQYNLGLIESNEDIRAARAVRLRNLNALLPDVSGTLSASEQQIDLRALGFTGANLPGFNIPSVVGPFSVTDVRGFVTQQIFNLSDIRQWKSSIVSEQAARYTNRSDRDLVVFTTTNAYLVVISDRATVDSTRAQLTTAQALHDRAVDMNKAGVIAGIDVLRARVELQSQHQRLIAAENQLSVDKLVLARIIGLPKGQQFEVTDRVPFVPLTDMTLEGALERAVSTRPDYLSALASVRAAELERRAAVAGNYPSLSFDGDYGDIGSPNFGTSHGTFSATVSLNIPIFPGTRVRADVLAADAALRQRKAELEDLDGRIDEDVRRAFFNLQSTSELVTVARSNIELAEQTLVQARDRFAAGVANNLDVVQAQESIASANQSYIASLYAYNAAKISLALAMGIAEQSTLEYLGIKQP